MKFIKNTPKIWIKKFPWKKKSSNKYSRGRVLILGGQKHMIGATILAAEACLRVGVGSVKIICTKETIRILSLKFPSALKVEINNISKYLVRSFKTFRNPEYVPDLKVMNNAVNFLVEKVNRVNTAINDQKLSTDINDVSKMMTMAQLLLV